MQQVLFIFFQSNNRSNGGVNSLIEILGHLDKVEPIVLTQKKTIINQILKDRGIVVIEKPLAPGDHMLFKILALIKFNIWVFTFSIGKNYKVVHINDIKSLRYSIIGLRMAGKRVVFNLRGVLPKERNYGFKWLLINFCKDIIVLSNEMKKSLLNRLPILPVNRFKPSFHTIYSIVDFERFTPNLQKSKLVAELFGLQVIDKCHLLYVAAFSELKNQLEFINKALPFLTEKKIIVHFVGDDDNDYAQESKRRVKELNLDHRCEFHGFQKNIEFYFQAATITLIPTSREGLARCMIESLACGTPVISFEVSSAKEILEQYECGVVVPLGDYSALVKAVIQLLRNPQQLQSMSNNGYTISKKLFNKNNTIPQYESIYLA